MKSIRFILIAMFAMFTSPLFAQQDAGLKTETIKVSGECEMCKSRIEKSLKMDGIEAASWNSETKLLTVTYNTATISNDAIQKKIASVGYDTEKYSADTKTYNKLPGCCQYERKTAQAETESNESK